MRTCRHEGSSGPRFSDEQLRIWHDLAARGTALPFNTATMEAVFDELIRLRGELTAQRRHGERIAELYQGACHDADALRAENAGLRLRGGGRT